MSKKSINILIILIVLPFLSLFSKERSSVILNTLPVNTYYLYGYQKGNEFLIDSIITKKNNSKFKKSITQGQYVIKEKKGSEKKSLFSFFVPDKKEKFVFSFSNNEAKQLSGTLENSLYLDLQNSLNNASEKFTTNIEFVEHLDSLYNISDLKIHNSFLYILLNGTLNKGSNSFSIWDEPKLINTQFVDTQINKYLKGIEKQNNSSILDTIDNIILNNITLKNLEYKSYLAQELFSYFSNSNIMGKDEIAVRIAQNYFLNNKLILPKTEDFILLQNYVSLNKSSLIGMRAPNLDLLSVNDDTVSLNSLPSIPTIIFFYTDNCGVCKSEIIKLIDFINGYNDGMLNVYAVYTDANKDIWKKYIQENFADEIYNPFINWVNVYDPTMESGFHLLYNVLATPQMYLLDNNKKIIGRNLNTRSLSELMRAKNENDKQLKQLFTSYFEGLGNIDEIRKGIDYYYSRANSDSIMLNDIIEVLFETLRVSDNYNLQEGAKYLADNYIINNNLINNTLIENSIKWLKIYNMNPLGSNAFNLLLETPGKSPIALHDIQSPYKVLYFYNIECGLCEIVTPKLKELYNEYNNIGIEFIGINTGSDYNNWIKYIGKNNLEWVNLWGGENRSQIYNEYYLESVPAIYLLKENMVIAKDINDIDLSELLKLIKSTKYD